MHRRPVFLGILFTVLSLQASDVIELSPYMVVAPSLLPIEEGLPGASLRESKPIDLASLLASELPGIALSRKSPLAGDIVMRGMTRDNILITVDNTRTYCACPNRMDPPAFHVSSQQIESIRIRKGPFSVNQGSTVGGAVFVRTIPTPSEPAASAYGFIGSFSYLAAGLSVGSPLFDSKANWQAGLYLQQGDVFEDGSGLAFTHLPGTNYRDEWKDGRAFKVINLESKLSFQAPGENVVTLNYALQDAQDVLYPGLKMDALTDTMNRGSISLAKPLASGLADKLNLSLACSTVDHDMQDTFRTSSQLNPAFAERGFMMRTVSETAFLGFSIEAVKQLESGILSYGADLAERQWDANNIIMLLENDMLPDVRVRSCGIWAVLEQSRDAIRYEAGLRLDHARSQPGDDISFVQSLQATRTEDQADTLVSAYLLGQYDLNEAVNLFAGIGHGERLPDPQERYINLNRPPGKPDWVGNPDLDPVKNSEFQFGGRFRTERLSLSLSAFHAWLNDFIYLTSIQGNGWKASSYDNLDARIYGYSGELSLQLADAWFLRSSIAWQEGVKSTTLPGSTNDYLAEVPPLRAAFLLAWSAQPVSIRLSAHFQDNLDRVDPDLHEQPIGSSWTINLLAHWNLSSNLTLSAGVDNLFDQTYAVANSHLRDPFANAVVVREPGRFVYFRLSASY